MEGLGKDPLSLLTPRSKPVSAKIDNQRAWQARAFPAWLPPLMTLNDLNTVEALVTTLLSWTGARVEATGAKRHGHDILVSWPQSKTQGLSTKA